MPRQNKTETRQDLGVVASSAISLFITIALLLAANVLSLAPEVFTKPAFHTLILALPLGAFLLAPRNLISRLVVDGPMLLICAWTALSVTWSLNQTWTIFEIRRDIILLAFVSVAVSLIPTETAIRAILRSLYLGLAVTAIAVAVLPEARAHIPGDLSLYEQSYPGWHGLFIHKNTMSPYLIFAGLTIAMFERRRVPRFVGLTAVAVLMIGSQSGTGLSALMFVLALWVWFRFYHRTEGRSGTTYVVASATLGLVALIAAGLSLSAITSAYGKDLTFSGRTDIWGAGLKAASNSPWIGYGQGGLYRSPPNQVTRDIWNDVGFIIPHSHSGTLDVLLTLGLVGVVLFGIMFLSTIGMGVKLLNSHPRIAEWALSVTAAQLLMGLSESVFIGPWLVYAALLRTIMIVEINNDKRTSALAEAPKTDEVASADSLTRQHAVGLVSASVDNAHPGDSAAK